MDIRETRKANLLALIGERAGGSVVRFAEMVGLGGHSYFSQIIGPKGSRNLGHTVARRIEHTFALERGWMDKDHGQEGDGAARVSTRALELARQIDTLPELAQDHVERMVESMVRLESERARRKKRR